MSEQKLRGAKVELSALLGELRDRVLVTHGGPPGIFYGWNLTEGDSLLHKAAIDAIEQLQRDAERYRWLRERDIETIHSGGVFAGMTPKNVVLNGDDLDREIDAAMTPNFVLGFQEGSLNSENGSKDNLK